MVLAKRKFMYSALLSPYWLISFFQPRFIDAYYVSGTVMEAVGYSVKQDESSMKFCSRGEH